MAKTGPKGGWKYKKSFHPKSFIEFSSQGKSITQIAKKWNVSRGTIYEWYEKYPEFSDAVKKGKDFCDAWYTDIGQAAMLGQDRDKNGKPFKLNITLYIWLTKNICKWNETSPTKEDKDKQICTWILEDHMKKDENPIK